MAAGIGNPDVAAVLRILADSEVSWSDLYHVFDLIESTGADLDEWSTAAERRLFTWTANNRGAIGDQARHGHMRWQPPPDPMAHGTARTLLRRIATGWLNEQI